MKKRNLFTRLPMVAVAMCLLGGNAHAELIDDFNGADFTVPDPDSGFTEVPQPYANAIGGWRVLRIEGSNPGNSLEVSGGVLTLTGEIPATGGVAATSTVIWEGSPAVKSFDPSVDLTDGGSSDRVRVDIAAVDPRCDIVPLRVTVRNGSCFTELTQDVGLGQAGPYDFPFADFTPNSCPFDGFESIDSVALKTDITPVVNGEAIACIVIDNIETVGPPQGNQAPTADAGGPYSGKVGTDIGFDGSGSSDPEGTALTYNWDFGDDGIGFGAYPGYFYTSAGTYHVTLTVTDESGVPASTSTTATVGGLSQQPVADAGGPYTGTLNVPVDFDGSGSSDPEGLELTYDWDFGDGSPVALDAGPTPSHPYGAAIKHTVTLTVTNKLGEDNAIVTYATIAEGNQPPVADPNGPYTGTVGTDIVFDGSGSSDPEGTTLTYSWDFGDDNFSTEENPLHSYAAEGFYHVTLTVTDQSGAGVSNSTTTVAGIEPGTALDCSTAVPSTDVIWPPNRAFVAINVLLDGDPASITIDSIFQDEPVGRRADGSGVGTDSALVLAQRLRWRRGGNGRVYHIGFTADDGQGASCTGNVTVSVPILPFFDAIDDGANFDSTVPTGN